MKSKINRTETKVKHIGRNALRPDRKKPGQVIVVEMATPKGRVGENEETKEGKEARKESPRQKKRKKEQTKKLCILRKQGQEKKEKIKRQTEKKTKREKEGKRERIKKKEKNR